MSLANKITLLRIGMIPFFIFFLLYDSIYYNYIFAGLIFIIASITDHIDGRIARKRNEITDFGKFADPLADKILVISAFMCFVELGSISSIPVIIIIAREFIVTGIRLMAVKYGKVIDASIWGKAKTVSQMATIIMILFCLSIDNIMDICNNDFLDSFAPILELVSEVFLWISVVLTVISGIKYVKDNIEFIKN